MVSACPTITTERLVMRPFRESDVGAYQAILATAEVRASLNLPDAVHPELAWEQMAVFLGQWELRGTGHWALEEKASGAMVGRAGLHNPMRKGWPGTEVGWTLHPDHWGKGYATEAGLRSRDYAFEELAVDRLFSLIRPENERSAEVARRLGLELTETRIMEFSPSAPHGVWELTREAWQRAQPG